MAMPSESPLTICALVNVWPRRATTFIAQEFIGLEAALIRLWLVALEHGGDQPHELHDRITAPVHYLPAKIGRREFLQSWRKIVDPRRKRDALRMLARDLLKIRKPRLKLRTFARAVTLAAQMPPETELIYFHFVTPPGKLARYVAAITGLPLAGSAHARDIWVTREQDVRTVLGAAEWVTTCNLPGAERLRQLAPQPDKIHLIYHGVDLGRFPKDPPERGQRDGSDPAGPVRLLSVGRAVEKKGFDILLEALAALPGDLQWHWQHIGEGKRLNRLQASAELLGLTRRITWSGAQDQQFVIEAYRNSDLFVLPSRQAADGDQDGLPNVLMEAQTQALACLSTNFTAIPELIEDGQTGVLVPPGDVRALAIALEDLIRLPDRRHALGIAGYDRVRRDFRAEDGIAEIARLIRDTAELGRK